MSKNLSLIIFVFIYLFQNSFSESVKDIYPQRKSIKGLQPDFQDPNILIQSNVHGVTYNFIWYQYQPSKRTSCASNQVKYDGYCYTLFPDIINQVKTYTSAGVVVTGILYGPPDWARVSCTNAMQEFCAPKDEATEDFGRFAGFIAWYFNGDNGNGRVADFVIHNEVNSAEWFNYGPSDGNYDPETWTSIYANSFNAAYDRIKSEQNQAKVLLSFDHFFDVSFDMLLYQTPARISVQSFLSIVVPKLGNREWRVAYHAYPPSDTFSTRDYPLVTFGNIGVLEGWLRNAFPNSPFAWEIQLTENGINCKEASTQQQQSDLLCIAMKNALGTPGIESFIYHRLIDHQLELELYGVALGLWESDGTPKKSWKTFTYSNSNGEVSGYPSCGFEFLPYIELTRAYSKIGFHWVTSRTPPEGYIKEQSWKILRKEESGTSLVFECMNTLNGGKSSFITKETNCEGQFNMGPMGYVYNTKKSGTVALYRCLVTSNGDHFISSDYRCEGQHKEQLIGYVYP